MFLVFKNVIKRYIAKCYYPVSLLSVVSKIFEKLLKYKFFYLLQKYGIFLISIKVSGLLTVVSDRIAGTSVSARAVEYDISKPFDRNWCTFFFIISNLIEYQVGCLALFFHFSVVNDFYWFWTMSLFKNIQLILAFSKAFFLDLWFPKYILMTYLTLLFVILSSMLMTLLSFIIAIELLICGNN